MKLLVLIASLLIAFNEENMLAGKWKSRPSAKGNITELMFKNGNVLEGYTNRKLFASGRYFFNQADSILSFVDNGCNNLTGVYKVQFFSNSDSIRFSLVMDSCIERRNGIQRLVLGRND